MKISNFFNSKQIRVAVAGSLGIKFLSALFAFLNGLLLARYLSVESFGTYVLAFTTVTIVSIPVSLGLPNMIVRYVSKYEISQNLPALKGLLIRSNLLVLLTSILAGVIAFLLYLIWWKQYSPEVVETFWISFLLLPLLVFGSLRSSALMGLKYMILGQLPDTFIRNGLLFIGIVIMIIAEVELTPQAAMYIHVIAEAIAFIVGYFFLNSKLLRKIRTVKPVYHNKLWLKEATPFGISSGVQILKSKLVNYVLVFFGSLEAVALFDVAMRGATLVSFTLDALNKAISPYLSSAFENNNKETLQRIVTKTTRIVFVFALPVALVFIVGGRSLLSFLFGAEYQDAYVPLVILCGAQLINAMAGAAGAVLNMTGHQSYLSINQIQMMLINAVLSIPLVLYFDIVGAAIAFASVLVLQNILLISYIKRKLNVNTTIFK
ncbi:MAG: flippase [Bacteroidota bacterium]